LVIEDVNNVAKYNIKIVYMLIRQALKSTNTCPFKKIELETYVIIIIIARSSPKKLKFNNSTLK
jgi:hypothetical protein